ncbi:MAG: DUF58 domain-containing protein [Thermoplasmata archaeon]
MNRRKKNVLTRKGIALLVLSTLCIFTGLACGDIEPLVLSIMILCYFLYNVKFDENMFKPPIPTIHTISTVNAKINARREVSQKEAIECDFVKVKTILEDGDIGRGEIVEAADILDKKSRIIGSNRIYMYLHGRREIEYGLELKKRGRYTIGPIRYRIYDKAGLSFEDSELEVKDEVIVYPKIEEIKNALVESGFYRHYPGEYITRQAGTSTEFRTIRDYVRGDPIKRINWKASRRFNKWMVNEYERDNICDVVMFLDAREVSSIGSALLNPLENSIRALVAIASHLIKSHNHVGLVVYSDSVYTLTPAGGNAQLQRILSLLTFVEAKGNVRFITAVDNAEGYLSPKTGILLFSSLDYDPTIRNALYRLNAKGYEVTIISPSSIDFERVLSGHVCERYKMVRIERDVLLEELAGYAKIIDWLPRENIQSMLKRCFDE